MGSRTTPTPIKTTTRKPLSLRAVANEMVFLEGLHNESPNDDRIPGLVRDLKADFALAIKRFPGGDDLPEVRNPVPQG
jgi:hypothetical protein